LVSGTAAALVAAGSSVRSSSSIRFESALPESDLLGLLLRVVSLRVLL
jgi:uncharacterized lipoprotein YbaY